jgi:arylsulfatase A-like enzyme
VLEKLRASGLEENTLIFFFSDNGGPVMLGTSINGSRNNPLRGSKRTTLEGGIRVPFAIQWKGKLPAGKVDDRPIIQLDVLPTALAAAGVTAAPDWKLDGVNLLPYLTGENKGSPHETLYWRFGQQRVIRRGDWKLVQYDTNADESTPETRAASIGARPIISPTKLYNVVEDPCESKDLAAANPDKVKELDDAWQAWNVELAEPLWGQSRIAPPPTDQKQSQIPAPVSAALAADPNAFDLFHTGYTLADAWAAWKEVEE